jgi:hypothetical protein
MDSKTKSFLKRFAEGSLFFYFLIVATIFTLLEPIRTAIMHADFGTFAFYIGIFILILVITALGQAKLRARRIQPLKRLEFKPFEQLDEVTAWPRIRDQRALLSTLQCSKGKPVILVGESGVGKSVLVQSHIIPNLKNWKTILFDNYTNFQTQITNKIHYFCPNAIIDNAGHVEDIQNESCNLFVIFDQFEQFLSTHSKNTPHDISSRNWFQNILKSLIHKENVKILIIVRKEWYYDLRFLEEFVPPPIESFNLSGLRIHDSEGSIPTLCLKLANVMKNVKAPSAVLQSLEVDGEISPVEAQIVGCMLENKIAKLGEISSTIYNKNLGGKDTLINEFFDTTLRSAPDREVALQVLFALSIETRYRRQLTLQHILSIIHKPRNEVIDNIKFLDDQRLIHEGEAGHYQLRHDYLAERFHDLSGSQLDPKQRDNILFFGDEIRKDHMAFLTISESQQKPFKVASDWYMAFLAILVTARLTGPLYGVSWGWLNPLASFHTTFFGVDTFYIPIFVSHLAWSYYVTTFYRRIFSTLKEGWFGRMLSVMTLLMCTASVVLAVFIPCFWILSIGYGGFWVGLKLLQLSTTKGLSAVSKEDFRVAGRETIINVSFAIILGGFFGFYIYNHQPSIELARTYILISIPSMAILTYSMYVVARLHISKRVSSTWLGMFDRRPSKPKELISPLSMLTEND